MDGNLIKVLEKEREILLKKLSLIEEAILAYRASTESESKYPEIVTLNRSNDVVYDITFSNNYKDYDADSTIYEKIIYIIKTEKRFLHVREIAAIANRLEWHIPVTDFKRRISSALSFLKRHPDTMLVSKVLDGWQFKTFWGSKNWLDERGEIISDYMYKTDQVLIRNRNHFNL